MKNTHRFTNYISNKMISKIPQKSKQTTEYHLKILGHNLINTLISIIPILLFYYFQSLFQFKFPWYIELILIICIVLARLFHYYKLILKENLSSLLQFKYHLLLFLLLFTSIAQIEIRASSNIKENVVGLFVIVSIDLLSCFFSDWFIKNKPWIHFLVDCFTYLLLLPLTLIFPKYNLIFSLLMFTLILLRYLVIILLLTKRLSFFMEDNCHIFSDTISFILLLYFIMVFSKSFQFNFAIILGSIFIYTVLLYLRIFFFKKVFIIKQKEVKPVVLSAIVAFIIITIISSLLFILPDNNGIRILTLLFPAIVPIIIQNSLPQSSNRMKIILLTKFKNILSVSNIFIFFTVVTLNIFVLTIPKHHFPIKTLASLKDFIDLTIYGFLAGMILGGLSILGMSYLKTPKYGLVKTLKTHHKFPRRLHKW